MQEKFALLIREERFKLSKESQYFFSLCPGNHFGWHVQPARKRGIKELPTNWNLLNSIDRIS